jgi:hypothetical protein
MLLESYVQRVCGRAMSPGILFQLVSKENAK